ncbi:hypothetical protein LAZ67_4001555 [Cordylochernes scorpioides]|uniref:Reverse transcriptase n=1 Tax=Cordylochernes scorpioides TaxID=51811 RepID=A0ABY6KF31_9ARAC|nr:hypothetical protein LAZ67_4001555 [Cordylochernes scorpioides]
MDNQKGNRRLVSNLRYADDVGVVDTYLSVLIAKMGGSRRKVRGRMAMGRLTKLWKDRSITTRTKESPGTSFLNGYLCFRVLDYNIIAREENRGVRDVLMLRIPWTATLILSQLLISEDDRLLRRVQRNCLRFFGHIARRRGMEYTILTGKTSGRHIPRRPPTRFVDQLKKLTGLTVAEMVHRAQDRDGWRRIVFGILLIKFAAMGQTGAHSLKINEDLTYRNMVISVYGDGTREGEIGLRGSPGTLTVQSDSMNCTWLLYLL